MVCYLSGLPSICNLSGLLGTYDLSRLLMVCDLSGSLSAYNLTRLGPFEGIWSMHFERSVERAVMLGLDISSE